MPSDVDSVPLSSPAQLLYCEENAGAYYELAMEIEAKCADKITTIKSAVVQVKSVKSLLDSLPVTGTFPEVEIDDLEEGLLFTTARERTTLST